MERLEEIMYGLLFWILGIAIFCVAFTFAVVIIYYLVRSAETIINFIGG